MDFAPRLDSLHAIGARAWAWLSGTRPQRRLRPDPAFVAEYDAIYATLSPHQLTADDVELDARSLEAELMDTRRRVNRFLGFYSAAGIRLAMERYGFVELLRTRGFDPVLSMDPSDADEQRLWVYDGVEHRDHLLIELALGRRDATLPNGREVRTLFINWLQMQDPRASFGGERAPLPDQLHPGLGLFVRFAYLLHLVAARIGCDALSNHPAHPHNAALYGKVCRFVDPETEGRFRALERDLGTDDLARFTDLVESGRVVDSDGEVVTWAPGLQMHAVSPAAAAWFRSRAYRRAVRDAREAHRYRVLATA
ncbi:MAG: hypothetical protein AAF602_13775 [Myxococcota bacterium]